MCATRRSFLGKAAATAVVTASSLKSWGQKAERELTTAELIGRQTLLFATPQTFEQWLNGTFKLSLRGVAWGSVELVKVESRMYPRARANVPASGPQPVRSNGLRVPAPAVSGTGLVPEYQTTDLWFKRTGSRLFQDTWTLEHDWLGTFDLMLVPLRPAIGVTRCIAVITHVTGRMVPNGL